MSDPALFTETTQRHKLPFLFAGQAQKEFTVNEALARIDALLNPAVVEERNAEPSAPAIGDCYLVAAASVGEFLGQDNNIACWDGEQWSFASPSLGMLLRDNSNGNLLHFDGSWQRSIAPTAPSLGDVVDAEARTAIGEIIEALKNFGIFS